MVLTGEYASLPLYDHGDALISPGVVDESVKPPVFSEAFCLAARGVTAKCVAGTKIM